MVNFKLLRFFALFATGVAMIVIGLGATTRLLDAGLGCPDWPGCYGHFIPTTGNHFIAYKAWAEMIHRYAVTILSSTVLIILILIFTQKKYRDRQNVFFGCALIILLIYQILLGRWTVTLTLWPIIVTQHLIGGCLIALVLWVIYLLNSHDNNITIKSRLLPWAMIGEILIFLQIILGAWTSTHYAGLSCPDFPFCINNRSFNWEFRQAFQIMPMGLDYSQNVLSESVRQTIHMLHRLGALILSFYLFIFIAMGLYELNENQNSFLNKHYYLMMALLLLQICLGLMNVVFQLPIVSAVLHTIVAVLLLLTMTTILFRMMKQS